MNGSEERPESRLRAQLHEIIFEAETPAGRAFDVVLLWTILASVIAVCLESVERIRAEHGTVLRWMEWAFTAAFAVEYALRIYSVKYPLRYMRSFFGLIDLLAIVPTPISLLIPGTQSLLVIRVVRLLRVFRVLKLTTFHGQAEVLMTALAASRQKITVFLGAVLCIVVVSGSMMYLIEGPEHGFDSIPRGMYWAIVTLTTVGFGDITPRTVAGQSLASIVMVMGYGVIAVPTGIVSVELAHAARAAPTTRACPGCGREGHDEDARHCKFCGHAL